MYRVRSNIQNIIIILLDMVTIILSLIVANFIRHYHAIEYRGVNDTVLSMMAVFIISYFILYLVLNFNRGFLAKGPWAEFTDVLKMNISMIAIAMVIMYFTRIITDYSRLVFVYFCAIDTIVMALFHTILKKVIPSIVKQTSSLRYLAVVTNRANVEDLLANVDATADYHFQIDKVLLIDESPNASSELIDYCKTASIDEVLFSLTAEEMAIMNVAMRKIASMGIAIHINMDPVIQDITSSKILTRFGNYYAITYADRFLSLRQTMFKRAVDIFGGLLGLLVLIPVTIVVAPLIKIESKGPVFFSQQRVGRNGRIFQMYKFRSMYSDAEARKQDLLQSNEMNGPMFKLENDPRVTKIGRFLRKTSLDEFPQFLNVLKGNMSLVGTRPPTLDEFEKYHSHHKKRLSITPGLTGLWQVSGRNKVTDFEEVVRLDVEYIENWSIEMDIKIILKTIGVVLRGTGSK